MQKTLDLSRVFCIIINSTYGDYDFNKKNVNVLNIYMLKTLIFGNKK